MPSNRRNKKRNQKVDPGGERQDQEKNKADVPERKQADEHTAPLSANERRGQRNNLPDLVDIGLEVDGNSLDSPDEMQTQQKNLLDSPDRIQERSLPDLPDRRREPEMSMTNSSDRRREQNSNVPNSRDGKREQARNLPKSPGKRREQDSHKQCSTEEKSYPELLTENVTNPSSDRSSFRKIESDEEVAIGERREYQVSDRREVDQFSPPPEVKNGISLKTGTSEVNGFYVMPKKPERAIREGKQPVNLLTNIWQLDVENKLVYQYDVSAQMTIVMDAGKKRIDLSGGPRDECSRIRRAEICRLAIKKALEMYRVLREGAAVAYDGAALLFSSEPLAENLKPISMTVEVTDLPKEAQESIRNERASDITIEISPVRGSHTFNMRDVSAAITRDKSKVDHTIKQFFEVVSSAKAFERGNYTFFRNGKIYNKQNPSADYPETYGSGHVRMLGVKKGITFLEGEKDTRNQSRAVAALVLDSTIGTFYREDNLVSIVCELNSWRYASGAEWTPAAIQKTNHYLSHLRVLYQAPGSSSKSDFIPGPLVTEMKDGQLSIRKVIDVKEKDCRGEMIYTASKYSHAIRLPNWPCLTRKSKRNLMENKSETFFPLEFLCVAPNQRVPLLRQTLNVPVAEKPDIRFKNIWRGLQALDLDEGAKENEFMRAFGIRLSKEPLRVQGFRRLAPTIQYGKNNTAQVTDTANWRTGSLAYLSAATINHLYVGFDSRHDRSVNERDVRECVVNLQAAARSKGMKIDKVYIRAVDKSAFNFVSDIYKEQQVVHKANPQAVFLILYIDSEKIKSHANLKLAERRYEIITQHIIAKRMQEIKKNQRAVLENVLAKMNMKAGGLNYSVSPEKFAMNVWLQKKTMVIGYDVCHATGLSRQEQIAGVQSNPSVVGFAFNGDKLPDRFIGDFHYTDMNVEMVNPRILNDRMKWMLRIFSSSRGCLPDHIVVVRDGISEGQLQFAKDECEALKEAALEYGNTQQIDYKPPFTMIIATKRHKTRFVQESPHGIRNAPTGTVVDDVIVRPEVPHFYMQPHNPILGTSKFVDYKTVQDDMGYSSDAIQSFMMALCYEHQISPMAVSIPAPVYQADEWAKRGQEIYQEFKAIFLDSNRVTLRPEHYFEDVTAKLSYWNSKLEMSRANA